MTIDDVMTAQAISEGLGTRVVGSRLSYFPTISSTMDVARNEALAVAPEGTVVIAENQTAGRGRLKRSWLAPSGNIALSVLLYPRASELPSLIMLAALAVARSIEAVTNIKPEIKWPNDVLIKGRKVCGILIEADARISHEGRVAFAVIGIGVNVDLDTSAYSEIERTATSLSLEKGERVSRVLVVRRLLTEMDALYIDLESGKSIFEEWRDSLVTLGRRVTVTSADTVYEGVAEAVERDGSLKVRMENGDLRKVVAGDVTLRE